MRDDAELRAALLQLDPPARDSLRRLLVGEAKDRDALASTLLRQRTETSTNLADLLDMLTLDDEVRRRVLRLLGELQALDS